MSFDGVGEFFNELSHGLRDLPGALLVFVPRELPLRRRDGNLIVRAFDHDAAVSLAEPFEVKRVCEMLGRLFFSLRHRIRLLDRNLENARFARSSHVAGHAELFAGERIEMRMGEALSTVSKGEYATGEIRASIPFAIQNYRLIATCGPAFAASDSLGA